MYNMPWLVQVLSKIGQKYITYIFEKISAQYIILIVINIIVCSIIYLFLIKTPIVSIGTHSTQTLNMISVRDSLYNSVAREIKTCGINTFSGKINVNQVNDDTYYFTFDYLMDSAGRDVRYLNSATRDLYTTVYMVDKNFKNDLSIIKDTINSSTAYANYEILEARNSKVFIKFFQKSALGLSKVYYTPIYHTNYLGEKTLLYIATLTFIDEDQIICNPTEVLDNISKYMLVYYQAVRDTYNII